MNAMHPSLTRLLRTPHTQDALPARDAEHDGYPSFEPFRKKPTRHPEDLAVRPAMTLTDISARLTHARRMLDDPRSNDRPSQEEPLLLELSQIIAPPVDHDPIGDEESAEATDASGSDYQPISVVDHQGRPLRPLVPLVDRRDVYRLVMAHRRLDDRTSAEIMDAAGVGRTYANSMLNRGEPGNDASLLAVAALYDVPVAIAPRRGIDLSLYQGMDGSDVVGPPVLTPREIARRGGKAVHERAADRRRPASGRLDPITPPSDALDADGKDEEDRDPGDDFVATLARFGRILIEARAAEKRAVERAENAERRAQEAEALNVRQASMLDRIRRLVGMAA